MQDADRLVLVVFHGDDQHGLCPVAVLPVEVGIEVKGKISRSVGILDVQDFSCGRRVTREAVSVNRQGEVAEGNRMAVTLR